jgi:hypothetical protein
MNIVCKHDTLQKEKGPLAGRWHSSTQDHHVARAMVPLLLILLMTAVMLHVGLPPQCDDVNSADSLPSILRCLLMDCKELLVKWPLMNANSVLGSYSGI